MRSFKFNIEVKYGHSNGHSAYFYCTNSKAYKHTLNVNETAIKKDFSTMTSFYEYSCKLKNMITRHAVPEL